MATKVLEVHLVGDGVSLERAFAGSAKSATAAANTIEASGARIAASGKKITAVGKAWNRTLTLPLLAAGGAAVVTAFKFERSMSLISTQAGGTRKEVDRLEKKVLALAKSTQWTPDALAEGLYHVESAGYRSGKAMTILNEAQKLATVGNSNLEETTYALVSAVKALGIEGFGPTRKIAAELNSIVGIGDMRMQELTTSLSSGVLSTAKMAGIGLRDVGAAMDIMTSRGEPAQIAATRLRMSISLMSAPTEKAQKALAKVNLRALDLASTMRKEGLGAAVKELAEHLSSLNKTRANQVLAEAFGGGRSSGAIKALVLNYSELLEKERLIGKGVRNYSRDVKEAEAQPLVKMKAAWASIEADLVEIGKAVGPPVLELFESISGAISSVTHSFSGLDKDTQKIIVTAAMGVAAMGPLLIIGGKLYTSWGKLVMVVGKTRTALASMALVEATVVDSEEATIAANDLAATSYAEVGAAAEASAVAQVAAAKTAKTAQMTMMMPEPVAPAGQLSMLATPARASGSVAADAEIAAVEGAAGGAGLTSGVELAKNLTKGFASKFGPLIAAAGLADIVIHATQGDWKAVGFEAGGSIVGGIAGFFLGGPAGAALGAGLGAFGGDLANKLFGGGDNAMSAFQKQTEEVIKRAVAGRKTFARSSHLIVDAEKRLENIGQRQKDVTQRLEAAQRRLNDARKAGDTGRVRREEAKVNELKAKQINLTHRQYHAETDLHTAKVKSEQDARRQRTFDVALIRTREAQFEQSKKRERQARKEYEQAVLQQKPLKEQNEKEKDLIKAQKRRQGSSEKLKAAEKDLGGVMKEITQKFGKQFADQLREQIPLWKSTATQIRRGEAAFHQMAGSITPLNAAINKYKSHQKEAKAATEAATGPLYKLGNRAKETGQKIQHAKTEVVGGFTGMEAKGTSFLQALKVQSPFTAPAKASGGYMVKGHGLHDTVPVMQQDVAAMVAPGEMLAVINRHQAPLLSQAVTNEYGVNGLGGFFNTFNKPHYMATGGLIEPKIQTGGAFRRGEQKEVHQGFKALNKYLQEHSEPKRVHTMLRFAEREAHQGFPYVFGGGHGSFTGPYDCSGYVSAILHAGNFLSTPMSTQQGSGLNTLGEAGPGKWFTWGVRGSSGANAHTMMAIKKLGNQGWGYFESGGSGGGAHEDSGWDGSFEFRHMPGYAKGGVVGAGDKRGRESWDNYIANAEHTAHQAWHALGRGAAPEPKIVFDSGSSKGSPYVRKGTRTVHIPTSRAGDLWKGRGSQQDYIRRALVHEFAHTDQLPGIMNSLPEREGGATWFANIEAPGVWAEVGLPYSPPPNSGKYAEYLNRVQHEHNPKWAMHGQFQHFAQGGIVPNPVKKTLRRYGAEATDPRSPHFVGWGYNKGGVVRPPRTFTTGGIPHFSTGGPVPPKNGELVGASYYGGPTDHVSGTVGAAGVSLPGTSSFAELAMGHALGGLSFHTKLEFSRAGKSVVAEKLDIGAGGDPVSGHNRAVDFWYETGAQLGIGPSDGVALVRVKPASSSLTGGTKQAEVVPGVFKGAKTHSLSFPSVPKNMPAIKREITKWQKEAAKYRKAISLAKDKPKTQHGLQANLAKIENFLRQLYTARSKARFEKAKKKLHTKIAKQLGRLTGKEVEIEKIERAYNESDETATQTVEMEPQAPRSIEAANPDDAGEVKRVEQENKANEGAYVKRFQEYVDHQERNAYEKVLAIETGWRNKIIEAERFATFGGGKAFKGEIGWETEARSARVQVESINRYTDKVGNYINKVKGDIHSWQDKHSKLGPKDYPDWLKHEISERDTMIGIRDRERTKLPMLREQDRSFSTVLGEGREHFYGGEQWIGSAKDFQPPGEKAYPNTGAPLNPPKPPLPGTGSLEEALINVQGNHWPDQHAFIETLPGTRNAGRFGGVIWDTQTAIEELGLKIAEAAGSGGGGGDGSGSGSTAADELAAEKLQLTEEALLRERQARSSLEATAATMKGLGQIGPKDFKATFPWAGRYAKGGPVAALFGENGPEIGVVPEGTNVATASETESMLKPHVEINNHFHPDGTVDTEVLYNGKRLDAVVNHVAEKLGGRANHRAQSPSDGRVGTL